MTLPIGLRDAFMESGLCRGSVSQACPMLGQSTAIPQMMDKNPFFRDVNVPSSLGSLCSSTCGYIDGVRRLLV
jgi:hypothetical protein